MGGGTVDSKRFIPLTVVTNPSMDSNLMKVRGACVCVSGGVVEADGNLAKVHVFTCALVRTPCGHVRVSSTYPQKEAKVFLCLTWTAKYSDH